MHQLDFGELGRVFKRESGPDMATIKSGPTAAVHAPGGQQLKSNAQHVTQNETQGLPT